jgi:DNA-binding MarR family transcriptional regulator
MRKVPPAIAETELLRASFIVLIRVFHVNERTAPAADGQTKYSPYDFQSLEFVAHQPGCMATALASYLAVSPTTATSIINRLVARGLVQRQRPEKNRRSISLSLTAAGRTLHQAIVRQGLKNMAVMLEPLSPTERGEFLRQMGKIVDRVRRLEKDGV